MQTAEAEISERRLADIKGHKGIHVRVGTSLLQKNLQVGDLVNSWEQTNGEVNKKQFLKNVSTQLQGR